MTQHIEKALKHMAAVNTDSHDSHQNHQQIGTYLFHTNGCEQFPTDQAEIERIVNSAEYHKYSDHILQVWTKATHTGIVDAKATCAHSTKACGQCLKHSHATKHQENHFQHGHAQIQSIQNGSSILNMGNQFIYGRTRAFRFHQVHGRAPQHRKYCHNKHKYTHTAYPVGKAAPEQAGMGQRFHIRQYAGSCGGKSGNGLKQCIHIVRNIAGHHKGKCTKNGKHNPAKGNNNEAVPGI